MAKNEVKQKEKSQRVQKVLPVNTKAKDTFFKKVYEKEERQRELVSFLLGIDAEKVAVANVRPALFGNKENDFACMCDEIIYILTEAQASTSPNIPYRLLEYAVAGLRSTVDSERLLYGRARACIFRFRSCMYYRPGWRQRQIICRKKSNTTCA